jgi:hypothetical protein
MNYQKDPTSDSKDEILAENNFLKLKLGLEHGMKEMRTDPDLDPGIENQWLKSVVAFEEQFKNAKSIRLFDRIGRPAFKKWDTLTPEETTQELQRLRVLMENNGVELDCICEYDDAIIYKFLTEELFEHEIDDMQVPGMTFHFIYEEFYPNHDYDLRTSAFDFVNAIFTRTWNDEFDRIRLAAEVNFAGKGRDRRSISAFILAFQEAHDELALDKFEIHDVVIDTTLTIAHVKGTLSGTGRMEQGDVMEYKGACFLHFIREHDFWSINEFVVPGISGEAK